MYVDAAKPNISSMAPPLFKKRRSRSRIQYAAGICRTTSSTISFLAPETRPQLVDLRQMDRGRVEHEAVRPSRAT